VARNPRQAAGARPGLTFRNPAVPLHIDPDRKAARALADGAYRRSSIRFRLTAICCTAKLPKKPRDYKNLSNMQQN
jgi:hypothetical protein